MKKWEMKMNAQRELRKQGAALLYQRVKLLIECYDDARFRQHCETMKLDELDLLDAELTDVAATFMTLRSVMIANPDESQWMKRDLREMMAEALAAEKKDRKPRNVQSWKERALAAEKECERLNAEIASLQKILDFAKSKAA